MKSTSKKNYLSFNHPDTKNAYNTLLANIRFASLDDPAKSIVVTSVGMDEGKSSVSTNLGLAVANSGLTCCIVDADMRKRCVSNMINVFPKYGIYRLLSGRCKVDEAITQTPHKNLYFLDCEPGIPNPANMFTSKRFKTLVDYLHHRFDFVIFDTPPLVSFVDAAIISSVVDATLLVVRESKTKKTDLKSAIEQLRQANANIMGTVLTFSKEKASGAYYYAYYSPEGDRVSKHDQSSPFYGHFKKDDVDANLSTWTNFEGDKRVAKKDNSTTNQVDEHDGLLLIEDEEEDVFNKEIDFDADVNERVGQKSIFDEEEAPDEDATFQEITSVAGETPVKKETPKKSPEKKSEPKVEDKPKDNSKDKSKEVLKDNPKDKSKTDSKDNPKPPSVVVG